MAEYEAALHVNLNNIFSILIHNRKNMKDFKFEYMMLSRLQNEANAFFGTGDEKQDKWDCRYHNVRNIWGVTIESHIAEMKRLWQRIPQDSKPEWCTWEQIMELEYKSINYKE